MIELDGKKLARNFLMELLQVDVEKFQKFLKVLAICHALKIQDHKNITNPRSPLLSVNQTVIRWTILERFENALRTEQEIINEEDFDYDYTHYVSEMMAGILARFEGLFADFHKYEFTAELRERRKHVGYSEYEGRTFDPETFTFNIRYLDELMQLTIAEILAIPKERLLNKGYVDIGLELRK